MTAQNRSIVAFAPELVELLKRGALSRIVIAASPVPPTITKRTDTNDSTAMPIAPNQRRTRWSILTFVDESAAADFSKLQKLTVRLHALRAKMFAAQHEDAQLVYKAKIAIDEALGALIISPVDSEFTHLISRSDSTIAAPTLSTDPLAALAASMARHDEEQDG